MRLRKCHSGQTFYNATEALADLARRIKELQRQKRRRRRINCIFKSFGAPFTGPTANALTHGGTCETTCIYKCTDKFRVFIEAPSKSQCPFSNPPQVKDKPTLLLLSYGESPF